MIVISDGLDPSPNKAAISAQRAREADFTLYTIRVPSSAQVYIGPTPNPQEKSSRTFRQHRSKKQTDAFFSELR